MPQDPNVPYGEYDPIGNQVVSFYYEQYIENDRSLADRGSLQQQRAHESRLAALRADPEFLAASQAARPGQVGHLNSSVRDRVRSLRVLGGQ